VLNSVGRIAWDLRTSDLSVIRRRIAAFLKPFSLEADADGSYDARLCHRKLSRTELTLINYGNATRVDAGRMKSFHLVHIPLRGSYCFEVDGERLRVGLGQAHMIRPDLRLCMNMSADLQLLVLRTTDSRFAACGSWLQRLARNSNRGTILSCTDGPGASLGRTVSFLAGELMQGGLLRPGSPAADSADSMLISALVHSIARAAEQPSREQHGYIVRARQHILSNLKTDLSVAAIVGASGVSSRALFRAFRVSHGLSPMAWVRQQRLLQVQAELQKPASRLQTISEIASGWGFTHFGHFCAAYRRAHGETPTDTRRSAFPRSTNSPLE
jgi:AraC-like DNA-binding protein